MKKSWADHCSSDEDSEPAKHQLPENSIPSNQGAFPYNDTIDTDLSFTDRSGTFLTKDVTLGEEYPPAPPPVDFGRIPPNAPGRAPFTAHIGNLSFGVKEGPELADEVEKLVRDRYLGDESVTVTEARVGVDRETGKRKGERWGVEIKRRAAYHMHDDVNEHSTSSTSATLIIKKKDYLQKSI